MRIICVLCALLVLCAQARSVEIKPSDELNAIVQKVAAASIDQFKEQKLDEKDFAITVIDLRDTPHLISGSFRGNEGFYPASVVKLFYLGAMHRWLEDGKLADSEELRRATSDMIVKSTNEATNWILEAVTDAGTGPLLEGDEWAKWVEKRNAINRYYQSLGYTGINVCNKTFVEGPYGRDKIFLGPDGKNRNQLTTNATARLLSEIALGKMISEDRCKQMMKLLHRDPTTKDTNADNQNWGFSAGALPTGAKLWSKAGWTSTARHDAAYIETPDGGKFVSVVFTYGHANQRQILPAIVGRILDGLKPQL
jgi:hypothetical protein